MPEVERLFNVSRHTGGANYTFVDGHTAWCRYERLKQMHFPDQQVIP